MKNLIAVLMFVFATTGCGENDMFIAKTVADTKQQKVAIEERIQMFHPVVNIAGGAAIAAVAALPGEAKYAGCGGCHGSQGGGGVGPKLAGKTVEYIVGRLNQYKAGEKVGNQSNMMWGQAAGLSDQDMNELAEYIVTL